MAVRIFLRGIPAVRLSGLVVGIAVALVALVAWRVPALPAGAGADVSIRAVPSGELAVSNPGDFLHAPALIPSSPTDGATASVRLTNQSPFSQVVSARGLPATDDLDDVLQIQVRTTRGEVCRGSLRGFRQWTNRGLVLRPGASESYTVRAWIPVSVPTGWRGQRVPVTLQFRATSAPTDH